MTQSSPRRRSTHSRPSALALLLSIGCSGGPRRDAPPVDCGILDEYDFSYIQQFEGEGMPEWFPFGDETPGGVASFELADIPGGRCDSARALLLRVSGHTDWGAGFGEYNTLEPDGTDYEGISFWARATGYGTSTGFTLSVTDRNTEPLVDPATMMPAEGSCIVPEEQDGVTVIYVMNEAGMLVPEGADLPSPEDCGNNFRRIVTAHRQWYLHRLPFESFFQEALPNRQPRGIDRSALYQFSINVPKDSNVELWLDDLALYRRRPPSTDAPQ